MLAGLWNNAGSTVSNTFNVGTGGVGNAISGLWKGIIAGVSGFTSSFFPAAQKVTTQSSITAAAGASPNAGYRSNISPQALSLGTQWFETPATTKFAPTNLQIAAAAGENWVAQPTGIFNLTPAKTGGLSGTIDDVLAGMQTTAEKVGTFKTLADTIAGFFTKNGRTSEGPAETGNSRGVVTDINPTSDMGTAVGTYLTGVNQAVSDMVKGLFNLGYSGPQGAQPTVAVAGEVAATKPNYTMLIVVAIAAVVLYMFLRRK